MNKKIKLALLVASSFCAAGAMASCGETPQPVPPTPPVVDVDVTSVTLDKTELDMHLSDTFQLNATVLPENATNKALTYSSLRPAVATVDASGKITALVEGTTIISVLSQNNPAASAQVIVNVTKLVVSVNEVKLDVEALDLTVGGEHNLVATVLPDNATDKSVTFSSLDEDVATVDKDGKVSAIAAGNTYVFCSANDGSGKQAKVKVTVRESHIPVTSISVGSIKSVTLEPNAEQKVQVTVLPENATNKALTFISSQPDVVSVDSNGNIKALKVGNSSIIVQSVDDPTKIDTLNVTVNDKVIHVTGVTISDTAKSVEENGGAFKLTATVAPENADNKTVTWSSSNVTVAMVDGNGNVTPVSAGETDIVVKTADGNFEKSCHVTVTKTEIESLTMSESSILFEVTSTPDSDDKTHKLSATIAPSTATYKEVSWSSSNTSVATVDQNGLVTKGTAMGVATISAVHKNSGLTATCIVTVAAQAVTEIKLNLPTLSFQEGFEDETGVRQLSATVTPATAPNIGVKWESSNTNVVTVDQTGKVQLVGYGTDGKAVITCTSLQNPTVSASCSVTVAKANEFSLSLPVQTSKAYTSFLSNRGSKINPLEEFYVKDKTLQVGDDNPINLTPRLAVYKGKTPVDQSNWAFPYEIKVEKKVDGEYVAATNAEAEVISALTCDIQFKADAIGSEFKVTVIPGGLSAAKKDLPDAKAVYELHVVDGYNVTNEYELSYLDDSKDGDYFDNDGGSGDVGNDQNYETFKKAHNIDPAFHPTAVILQNDMMISPEHLPSGFFYTAEDAAKGEWSEYEKTKSLGSLKDRTYLFSKRYSDNTITLEGNYFSLDWSKIPVVRRPNGSSEDADHKVNSHSSVMRIYNGEAVAQNLNIIGNAHAASSDAQNYAMGGLIGFKYTGDSKGLTIDNIVEHACYITIMSEGGVNSGVPAEPSHFKNMKCFDNYNCFLYNWGGKMVIENSFFEGCGGPVMIQDHTGVDADAGGVYDKIDETYGQFIVYGHKPETTFIDCQFNNYVIGTEAWFNSFGATALSQTIKMMSDFLTSTDPNHLTFLFDEDKKGTSYTEAASAGKDCMMNFIVLNKSSEAEGTTAYPVDGDVTFINKDVTTDKFNYLNPTSMSAATIEEQERFTAECTEYMCFRGLQGAGAPVFETAGGHVGFYAADPAHPESGMLSNVYWTAIAGDESQDPSTRAYAQTQMANLPEGWANSNGYMAMYYNGMALILGTGHYGI